MVKQWANRLIMLLVLAAVILVVIYAFEGKLFGLQDKGAEGSPTVVEAIEKINGKGFVSYMIHEHPVADGEVAFFLRKSQSGSTTMVADYIRKNANGWKYVWGGMFSASNYHPGLSDAKARKESFHAEYFPGTEGTDVGSTPFPLYCVIALHPDISRIVVKDSTGYEKQAQIVPVEQNFKLFYVFLDASQGMKFEITGYDQSGNIIRRVTQDEAHLNSGTVRID
ncbi:hypothetical protein FHS19_005722 [Paenibacillus rhizosphaerae]|uniref:Uncharacterized protein n=1 Tax=Paenibacillus rhizosphaerae TaxID=297318 RepID=A0A839TWD7_9BACL|nr:hypothetical protein [Paenibacillus rhizosphaerae]MBB3131002.1 hypothetical protein [Paenibacillus rhizosphaerae]